ncbi:hypothetical protein F443_19899 [Phytophthora nicotianae P1569]|uniref:Uncharacterized protein n=1 Tax=Phytophthora nicotianae P1569 TaxID=1317065 RepID=V9E4H3_PHYNI|nr:hypothetical protein F443_19899 [Phytophthora nicotianae P1569]
MLLGMHLRAIMCRTLDFRTGAARTGKRKVTAPRLDVTKDMQEATDVMALTRMDLTAERIWKHIRQNF